MFFKRKKNDGNDDDFIKVTALLIHAAKIDENFTIKEEKIIEQTLVMIGVDKENTKNILDKAKEIENNSNQILEFTKEVKNMEEHNKIKMVKTLWRIIYSNNEIDIYESNLMRRLTGLLYIDSKTMGDIKEKIKEENSK